MPRRAGRAFRALVQASEAVSATAAAAGLERTTVELINLRVSQVNRCAYCLDLHTGKTLRAAPASRRSGWGF